MKHLLTVILLLVMLANSEAQKVKPVLNLVAGNTYYMASTATSSIIESINGQEHKISLIISFRIAFQVMRVTDSVYNMEVSYQSLDLKTQGAGGIVEMDSKRNDSLDVGSSIVKAMMNKPFYIMLSKSGKVRSVENVESMIESVFSSFPQIEAVKKEQIKTQFMQTFGPKAFKASLEIATAIFPVAAVSKNDSWVVATELESMTTAKMKTNYQLIDVAANYYQIHGDGVISTDENAPATMMDGLPVKYNLNGTTLLDIKADKTTGWITELKLKQLINGSIKIQDNPKTPGGVTIPMMIENEQVTTNTGP